MDEQRIELQKLVGDVLGLSPKEIPPCVVYLCRHAAVARAVTLRNAVHVLTRFLHGERVHRTDVPWHTQYAGMHDALLDELKRTGYLDPTVN